MVQNVCPIIVSGNKQTHTNTMEIFNDPTAVVLIAITIKFVGIAFVLAYHEL